MARKGAVLNRGGQDRPCCEGDIEGEEGTTHVDLPCDAYGRMSQQREPSAQAPGYNAWRLWEAVQGAQCGWNKVKEGSEPARHLSLFSEQDGEPLERFEPLTGSDLFCQESLWLLC